MRTIARLCMPHFISLCLTLITYICYGLRGFVKKVHNYIYNNLLEAAGDILMWISLMIYSGTALMAMITATFHANASETTKERSGEEGNFSSACWNRLK